MKKIIIIVTFLLLAVGLAWASVDYKCMADCQRSGYGYSYCTRLCSY